MKNLLDSGLNLRQVGVKIRKIAFRQRIPGRLVAHRADFKVMQNRKDFKVADRIRNRPPGFELSGFQAALTDVVSGAADRAVRIYIIHIFLHAYFTAHIGMSEYFLFNHPTCACIHAHSGKGEIC